LTTFFRRNFYWLLFTVGIQKIIDRDLADRIEYNLLLHFIISSASGRFQCIVIVILLKYNKNKFMTLWGTSLQYQLLCDNITNLQRFVKPFKTSGDTMSGLFQFFLKYYYHT